MAEENTNTDTSTGTTDASAAAAGAGGGAPAGFVPQAVLDAAEAKRRDLQSQLDKLRAAATPAAPATSAASTAESELAEVKALLQSMKGFDPASIGKQVQAEIARAQAVAEARTKLSTEFANARPEVLSADYATPEEMRVAVEASHTAESARVADIEKRVRDQLAATLKEQHGIDLAPAPQAPATSDGSGSTGPTTARDLAGMDFSALQKMSEEDIQKALART